MLGVAVRLIVGVTEGVVELVEVGVGVLFMLVVVVGLAVTLGVGSIYKDPYSLEEGGKLSKLTQNSILKSPELKPRTSLCSNIKNPRLNSKLALPLITSLSTIDTLL